MRRILFICSFCFTLVNHSNAQTDIFLREYNEFITPKKCNGSIVHYLEDSSFLRIKLENCKGKMSLKQYNQDGILVAQGQYIASLDTLKEYVTMQNVLKNSFEIKVHKFFQPLKDGEWIYYKNGQESKRERYKRGILIE